MTFTSKSATTYEIIKHMMTRRDFSSNDIAERLGISRQNFDNRLRRNNFCEKDLRKIAEVLNFELLLIFKEKEVNYAES